MSIERSHSASVPAKNLTNETTPETEPMEQTDHQGSSDAAAQRSKLSVNVDHDISERLRSLAYTHRLSESSIVEVALAMFFARGDDALLGVILKELGAVLRRK
jgi:hypothetical protein